MNPRKTCVTNVRLLKIFHTELVSKKKKKQAAHLRRKDRARNYKDELKPKVKGAPHVSSAFFDLQQALPCPHGQSSRFFYKRELSVNDLSIYELSTSDVVCNTWTEAISARGAKQIANCIQHFIDEQVEKERSL